MAACSKRRQITSYVGHLTLPSTEKALAGRMERKHHIISFDFAFEAPEIKMKFFLPVLMMFSLILSDVAAVAQPSASPAGATEPQTSGLASTSGSAHQRNDSDPSPTRPPGQGDDTLGRGSRTGTATPNVTGSSGTSGASGVDSSTSNSH